MDLRSILARLHDFIGAEGPNSSWWRRGLWYLVELGPLTYQKMQEDKAPQMAAALTYHTLFSLLPTLVLTLVVAKSFVSEAQLQDLKEDTVGWTLQWLHTPAGAPAPQPPEAVDDLTEAGSAVAEALGGAEPVEAVEAAVEAPAPSPFGGFLAAAREAAERAQAEAREQVAEATGERLKQEFNETAAKLDQSLQELLDRLQNISFASIGIVGVLLFLWGATTLLSTIEDSFNFILRNPSGRSWHMRFVIYFTTLVLAPLVLVAGQVGQAKLFSILETGSFTTWIVPLAAAATPLVAAWGVLFALYKLLPNASMRLVPALIGSFVAAFALGVTTWGFGLYVSNAATTSLYGAMALLPMFLLLLWIVWQIVLFGLELGAVIERLPAHREATAWGRADPLQTRATMPDPRMLIPVAAELASRFGEGKPATPRELAQRVGLAADTLQLLLERLVARGDAHRLPGEEAAYTLARPASAIGLPALLDETFLLGRTGAEGRTEALLAELDAAERRAVEGRSLADLLPAEAGAAGSRAAARPEPPPQRQAPAQPPPAAPAPAKPARRRFRLPFGRRRAAAPPAGTEAAAAADAAEPAAAYDTAGDPWGDAAAKGERRDSNPRPSGSQPDALTN
ncbi:hypothetical protein PSMK_27110 [Phycisphaera mikurensis NBRC 102666]|uniref:Uncharacterized protein n=1 Tax=Phycisphaera mikurensis (strain NBRC 102666 / KCTC 22515 / FYK2301M01) TaxID=1142394 RepID=I0IHY2_PHYMF|nr:hypothetical protein PSMK_27110 [Phycisphaera mikurensis NBRC 102666]